MEGQARGQGESIPIPPPRRRLSKQQMETDLTNNKLPATIHVTSMGVEGRSSNIETSNVGSSRKSWTKIIFYFGLLSLITLICVGLTLDYYDVWDPCVVRIPYERHCTVDTYLGGLFYRTDYQEESLCLVPGVFYSSKTTGWNTDGVCMSAEGRMSLILGGF